VRTKVRRHSSLTMNLVKSWQYNYPTNSSGSHCLFKHRYFSVSFILSTTITSVFRLSSALGVQHKNPSSLLLVMSLGTSSCITSKYDWLVFLQIICIYMLGFMHQPDEPKCMKPNNILLFHYSLTICDNSSLYKALILDMGIWQYIWVLFLSHSLINAIWWDEKLQCYDMKYAFLFLIPLFDDVYWMDLFRSRLLYHAVIDTLNRIHNRQQFLFPFFPFDFFGYPNNYKLFSTYNKVFWFMLLSGRRSYLRPF